MRAGQRGPIGVRERPLRTSVLFAALLSLAALAVPHGAAAASGDINTWAGGSIGDGYSLFGTIRGGSDVAYNSAGDKLYIADRVDNRIRVVSEPFSVLSTVAGTGLTGPLGDGGAAIAAGLSAPDGVTLDAAGNIFIADTGHNRIRKINTLGIISTVAGNGLAGFTGDGGSATAARLNGPRGVAVDTNGDLYIADTGNGRIRRVVASGGGISTVAGGGIIDGVGTTGDIGPATLAILQNPAEVALAPRSPTGAFVGFFIADARNFFGIPSGTIYFVNAGGNISRRAGCPGPADCGTNDGGPGILAQLVAPLDVAVDTAGLVYVADAGDHRIRVINTAGNISTVAGTGTGESAAGDGGQAKKAFLDSPEAVSVHPDRVTFSIADTGNFKIRRVSFGDIGPTVGPFGDGGRASNAWLTQPPAIATDSSGRQFIIDGIGRLRRVVGTTASIAHINTLIGDGPTGGYADAFNMDPKDVSVSPEDNQVYVADQNGDQIMRHVGNGVEVITTAVVDPENLAAGWAGWLTPAEVPNPNLFRPVIFVTNTGNSVMAVSKGKTPVAYAGAAACGYAGDGGPAASALLCQPSGMAVDVAGNLYIADTGNNAIRKVGPGPDRAWNGADDIISTVVATPAAPLDVSVGPGGTLYIALADHTVAKYTGVLTIIAGTGVAGFSGDGGPGSAAQLSSPSSVAFDAFTGRVYIADTGNNRVRFLAP